MANWIETINSFSNVDEVRTWISDNQADWRFFEEYPRGGGIWQLTLAMSHSKFAEELAADVKKISDYWYNKGEFPTLP